jgi:hypothetical protein
LEIYLIEQKIFSNHDDEWYVYHSDLSAMSMTVLYVYHSDLSAMSMTVLYVYHSAVSHTVQS